MSLLQVVFREGSNGHFCVSTDFFQAVSKVQQFLTKTLQVLLASVHRQALSTCCVLFCVLPGSGHCSLFRLLKMSLWKWQQGFQQQLCSQTSWGAAESSPVPVSRGDEVSSDHTNSRGSFRSFQSVVFGVTHKSIFWISRIMCYKVFSVDVYL